MSLTTNLIERLKGIAASEGLYDDKNPGKKARIIGEAIETIETLSAKLHNSQMERSIQYYHGGWIPVDERLPGEYGEYLITWTTSRSEKPFIAISEGEVTSEYDHENNRFRFEWLLGDYIKVYPDIEVIAWMPLPEPYKAESEE